MQRAIVAIGLGLLTWLGYAYFPGHTYLQQDTQIWIPVMEHLHDPSVLSKELIVTGAHVRLTLFDDVALWVRRATGLEFEPLLIGLQLLFRWGGLLGVYLLARALRISVAASLLAAALFGMGLTAAGPAVLSVEYEPVPRGFAFPLSLLALGLMAHNHPRWSAIALGIAFLFHAPTIWPYLLMIVIECFIADAEHRRDLRIGLLWFSGFVGALLLIAFLSPAGPMNPFWATLTPEHERLQRMRASYNWVSLWPASYLAQYAVLAGVASLACWRLRDALPARLKPYLWGLIWIGPLTIPASWLLLEQMKWALMPQIQPMRALLYTASLAAILAALAALHARRWTERIPWLALVCFLPLTGDWLRATPAVLGTAAAMTVITTIVITSNRTWGIAAACLLCSYAPLRWAQVKNYPDLNSPELTALVEWARAATPPDAVFLFRDLPKRNETGLFRSRARRAVYVDWKGGGQVNYYEGYAHEWWSRWQATMAKPFALEDLDDLRQRGIRYLVFARVPREFENPQRLVYRNARFSVVRL